MYYTYDNSFHQQTAGGLLNTLSDGSAMCATSDFPAIAFDRANPTHGLHIVYHCVPGGAGSNEIVHLFYDGAVWKRSQVTQVAMSVPSSTPGNSRLGFAVHNGRAVVVYWDSDGSLKMMTGDFASGSYSWSGPTVVIAQSSGVHYFTPQVSLDNNGLARIAFVVFEVMTGISEIYLRYETSIDTWATSSLVKTFQHATNRIFLGHGLGITGMAGNSAR
jgi:hypothetical protein